ncbi:MAG: GIY-YIG nuclease family protein [Firmicutes bacterium]|nr:GIY-YIG nuclease family protein [Bacillota bacterium]
MKWRDKMYEHDLKGWNFIVYILIKKNFRFDSFTLTELYSYEQYFSLVYPSNFHIKDKLRQTLQKLRDKGLLQFHSLGNYQLIKSEVREVVIEDKHQELVYLLSNESIPGWVKIGRTNAINRRLKELYNTSVPLPFRIEDKIETQSSEESRILEKSIHSIIDTLNPNLRKHTEAYRREFFRMSTDEGKSIFKLVTHIIGITPTQEARLSA